jgi:hypothetical protein
MTEEPEDTRRDWVSEGIIFGEMGNQVIMCSTLEGVPYFPDDVPIPPVGQDDAIQPEYMIMWSHKDEQGEQEYTPLGEFFGKVGYDMFASILAETIAKIGKGEETEWEPVPHKVTYTDVGPMKVEDNGVYLPLEDGYEYQMFRKGERDASV